MNTNKTIILISSCDAFSDCWQPLLKSIHDQWSDNPYDIYLIANSYHNIQGVRVLNVGPDLGWGTNIINAVEMLPKDVEYVIYIQDDFFLCKPVLQKEIFNHIEYMKANTVDYLRLSWPWIKDDEASQYNIINPTNNYSLCLQCAIWKRTLFNQIIEKGWSGWDYERYVHNRIAINQLNIKAFVIKESDFYLKGIEYICATGVRKGRWTNSGYDFLKSNGFEDLLGRRLKEPWIIGFCERNNNYLTRFIFLLYFFVKKHIK